MSRIEVNEAGLPVSFRTERPTITVVVVNLNGRDLLGPCLDSLVQQSYDEDLVEIILIDNASTDDSVSFVRASYPSVRILVNDSNVGFAPAINQAASVANGDYLALINNDAQADPNWLSAASAYLQGHEEVGCVASVILSEDRHTLDYAGSAMAFNGMGYAVGNTRAATEAPRQAQRTLFASGGAMMTPTSLFIDCGGFDDAYFAFFEDVDYGWRLWVLGHETHLVPTSRVFHRHHGTIKRFGYARERYLLERNALATIYKNYGDENLARVLPGSVLLTLMRAFSDLEDGNGLPDFAITGDAQNIDDSRFSLSALSAAHLAAMRDFGRDLDDLTTKRDRVQSRRALPDAEILPLFGDALRPNVQGREYLEVFDAIVRAFGLEEELVTSTRVLIVTGDTLSPRMAGPAIRAYEMATSLVLAGFDVTLSSLTPPQIGGRQIGDGGFVVSHAGAPGQIDGLLDQTDIVIFQGFVMHALPAIHDFDGPVVVDIYDPFHLENMTARKHELEWMRYTTHNSDTDVLNTQLQRGDFFVCASEKQRDFWLGQMSALRRVNPATFDDDESLRSLIDVAPFGLSGGEPVRTRENAIRGVVPGIDEDDFILLWGGGIYNWFDPLTLIEAVGLVALEYPDVKLWFMGNAHPNPEVPKMAMSASAYQLAEQRGLLGKHVFFNEGWVDYGDRQNYLMDADVGGIDTLRTPGDQVQLSDSHPGLHLVRAPHTGNGGGHAVAVRAGARSRSHRPAGGRRCVRGRHPATARGCRIPQGVRAEPQNHQAGHDVGGGGGGDKAMEPVIEFCRNPRRAADTTGVRKSYIRTDTRTANVVPERSLLYYGRQFARNMVEMGPATALTHAQNIVRHYLRR